MTILVTGGAGYIGSHTCVELLDAGYQVVVVDNLSNSSAESLSRVRELTGKPLTFIQADVCDAEAMESIFQAHPIEAVIHFAGLKAVGESVEQPLRYYQNNIESTLVLCAAMEKAGVETLIFSSSATVYGDPHSVPITENFPLSATNPYGRTKLFIEQILKDQQRAQANWKVALLRYFNPVGAHASGRIGEDPSGIPNNLMPYIAQVAVGRREYLSVFGNDYDTDDGSGVRDYIHVVDLAKGHLAALEYLLGKNAGAVLTVNLGTGNGYSVIDMAKSFAAATGKDIPWQFAPRRAGDIDKCFADPSYAAKKLNWRAELSLDDMCRDTWRWQSQNPNGYQSAP
jgi:UDP-glucose 4-epimerase